MMLTAVVTSFAAPATLATVGASCAKAWLPNPSARAATVRAMILRHREEPVAPPKLPSNVADVILQFSFLCWHC